MGAHIVRTFSWFVAAVSTPIMVGITGFIFFVFVIISNGTVQSGSMSELINSTMINPLYMAVIVGAIQNILSKATKYSLFDASKEMAYIPLSTELRTKGKAAVEVVGMKFGKSSGSFMQFIIFTIFPTATFDSISLFLFTIFLLTLVLWLWNVFGLNNEYKKIMVEAEAKEELEKANDLKAAEAELAAQKNPSGSSQS